MKTIDRRTVVIAAIMIITGIYAGLFYFRRMRGFEFPIFDELVWSITEPPSKFRRWVKIDLRWRNLVAHRWETGKDGYIEVSRDGRAVFNLGSYHSEGSGEFGTEWPDDGTEDRANSLGFTLRFTQDSVRYWLELHPLKSEDGMMKGEGIEAKIFRFERKNNTSGKEVYCTTLSKPLP